MNESGYKLCTKECSEKNLTIIPVSKLKHLKDFILTNYNKKCQKALEKAFSNPFFLNLVLYWLVFWHTLKKVNKN